MPAILVFLALDKGFGYAVFAFFKTVLFKPCKCPAAVGIKVPLLFGQYLVEYLVDEL